MGVFFNLNNMETKRQIALISELITIIDSIDYNKMQKECKGICSVDCGDNTWLRDKFNELDIPHKLNYAEAKKFNGGLALGLYWFYATTEGYNQRKKFMEYVKADLYHSLFHMCEDFNIKVPKRVMLTILKQIDSKNIGRRTAPIGLCSACNEIVNDLIKPLFSFPYHSIPPSIHLTRYHTLARLCFTSKFCTNKYNYWFKNNAKGYKERKQFVNWLIKYYEGDLLTKSVLMAQLPFRFFWKLVN